MVITKIISMSESAKLFARSPILAYATTRARLRTFGPRMTRYTISRVGANKSDLFGEFIFYIIDKKALNSTVICMTVSAPLIAKKAEPGQFVILRAMENNERIPLTIADYDRKAGSITIIYQIVGAATMELNSLDAGKCLHNLAGLPGTAMHTEGLQKVCVVSGGVGCAIAYPVAKKLHEQGCEVHSVVGFCNKEMVILNDDFHAVSEVLKLITDDGTRGEKGLMTAALESLVQAGNQYDEVIAIRPLVMMKFVAQLTKTYGVKTIVSMNSIMIDGTGICGGCLLTVDGKNKFACVDGPHFDGYLVDFECQCQILCKLQLGCK